MKWQNKLLSNISVIWKLNLIIAVMTIGLLGVFIAAITGMQKIQSSLSTNYKKTLDLNTVTSQLSDSILLIQSHYEPLLNPDISIDDRMFHLNELNIAKNTTASTIEEYETVHISTNNRELSAIIERNELLDLQVQEVRAYLTLRRNFDQYLIADKQFQELYSSNGINNEYFAKITKSRLAVVQQNLSQLVEINNQYTAKFRDLSLKTYQDTYRLMTITLFLTIAAGWFFAVNIAKSIGSRLRFLERSASSVEEDFSKLGYSFNIDGEDEIALLGKAFNRLFRQLQKILLELEDRVQERTAELAASMEISERRAQQFKTITLASNTISSIRSLDGILPKITEVISQQFGYYHTGIFLNDANNEYTVLSAANSEGGFRMLHRGYKLRIGEQGIVGYVVSTGEPRISLDVGEDAVYFNNPDLPNTRSEIALPLKIGQTVVGALDVQSTEESAFNDEDISVLSLLADQVSMAIDNARLFDQSRKALSESETLSRQYLRQAWNRLPKEQNLAGFRYNAHGASPIEAEKPINPGNERDDEIEEFRVPQISVPIEIRGETIGTLSVQIPDENSLNGDQMDLVYAVAERVALSAENARLFEETTRRAEREHLVSDIAVKIRSTNDPDAMVMIALEELKQALGATKVQLVPQTLQKSDTKQLFENPLPTSNIDKVKKNGME